MEPQPAPPALEEINYADIDSYACTKCSSNIKLLSLDVRELKISFKCLNEDMNNNHQIQSIPINEYINKMILNTYFFDKCSICNKIQNLSKELLAFKYCIICNEVICEECKEKHINNNNHIKEHYFISNNEKRIKCLSHFQNNNYIEYCFECKKNLCKECLKTRMHIKHNKHPLDELSLLDENKINHRKIIALLIKDKEKLELKKQDFINNLSNKINEEKIKLTEIYEIKNKQIKTKLENEIKIKNDKLQNDLRELKQKYLQDVKFLKNQFEIDKYILNENFNKEAELNKKCYNDEIYKYTNQQKNNEYILDIDKKINSLVDLIKINEILRKTQEKNENNFYINENINKVIECFQNSENIEIRNISNQNIQILKNLTFKPIEETKNDKSINNDKNSDKNKYYNNIINNNANIDNNNFNNNIIKNNDNNKNHNYIINNNFNNNSTFSFLSKKLKSREQENKNNLKKENQKKKVNINKNSSMNNNKLDKTDKNINLQEEGEIIDDDENNNNMKIETEKLSLNKDKNNSNNININSYDIINDSFCPIEIENSFIIFESVKKIPYIIYATKDKSIVCYNLKKKKIKNIIPNSHIEFISSFYYCINTIIQKELIMSISYKDTNLKIWNFKNWQCIIDIKNVYSHGYLYSAYFLNRQNNFYFVTTNWDEESKYADSIKVYDYEKNIIKKINDSEYNVSLIKALYNFEETYFITCNEDIIKSYNYNENVLLQKYHDNSCHFKFLGFLVFVKSKRLYASCQDKMIRIFGFFSGEILYKIKIHSNALKGINLAKQRNMLIGYENNEIQLLENKGYNIVKTLKHNKEKICSIKKLYLNDYGSCIFSQGFDNNIIMWQFK